MKASNKKRKLLLLILALCGSGLFLYWWMLPGKTKLSIASDARTGSVDPLCNSSQDFLADNCTENISTTRIERPEWSELFPNAEFYLNEARVIRNPETNMDGYEQNNSVVISQGLQKYDEKNFDKLLKANQIQINDENRELVFRSFALITAANYLNKDLVFAPLESVDFEKGEARHPYNYQLSAVVNGKTEIHWCYVVKDGWIQTVTVQTPKGIKDYFFNP